LREQKKSPVSARMTQGWTGMMASRAAVERSPGARVHRSVIYAEQ
jgi:hypothetical protein